MTDNTFRKTNTPLAFLIHNLYGDDYRLIKSSHELKHAEKYFLRMLGSFELAIEESVKATELPPQIIRLPLCFPLSPSD
jgi:hypothetical protein